MELINSRVVEDVCSNYCNNPSPTFETVREMIKNTYGFTYTRDKLSKILIKNKCICISNNNTLYVIIPANSNSYNLCETLNEFNTELFKSLNLNLELIDDIYKSIKDVHGIKLSRDNLIFILNNKGIKFNIDSKCKLCVQDTNDEECSSYSCPSSCPRPYSCPSSCHPPSSSCPPSFCHPSSSKTTLDFGKIMNTLESFNKNISNGSGSKEESFGAIVDLFSSLLK
jgi:hypothetical protein